MARAIAESDDAAGERDSGGALATHLATGVLVGVADICFVFPLAVLATRRENGLSLSRAIRMKNFWSGGFTAGSLLIPYSCCVEALSNGIKSSAASSSSNSDTGAAAPAGLQLLSSSLTALVVTAGLQPIEKKLTMDQMLQSKPFISKADSPNPFLRPLQEIRRYASVHGVRPLFGGFTPLLAREFIYISAVTVVNPIATTYARSKSSSWACGAAAAFSVGMCAGLISAPLQTLNALTKDERHRSKPFSSIWRSEIAPEEGTPLGRVAQRLFYGAFVRSLRTGSANVLYFSARLLLADPP